MAVLFVCSMGLLDLYSHLAAGLERDLHILAGGVIGRSLNTNLFGYFGTIGSTIVYLMLYFISLLFLTSFQLGEWVRRVWERRSFLDRSKEGATPEERQLERRARELRKEAETLEKKTAASGLGPDLRPVPEPVVTDLSIPQSKGGRARKPAPEPVRAAAPVDAGEGEVIPATEIEKATTEQVLGRKPETNGKAEVKGSDAEAKPGEGEKEPEETPLPLPAPTRRPGCSPKSPSL